MLFNTICVFTFGLKNEDQEMFLLYPKKEFLGLQVWKIVPFVYNYYVLKCAHTSAYTINSWLSEGGLTHHWNSRFVD